MEEETKPAIDPELNSVRLDQCKLNRLLYVMEQLVDIICPTIADKIESKKVMKEGNKNNVTQKDIDVETEREIVTIKIQNYKQKNSRPSVEKTPWLI